MIYAFDINKLDVVCKNAKRIILTGSVKYHTAKFNFSEGWEHFSKTAYFINKSNDKDEKDISVPIFLSENETMCLIPWEVLTREGQLIVSIQGVQDDTEIWTKMNRPIVLQKSDKDNNTMPQEPTIPIYNQLLNKLDSKGDSIQFEDDTLSLKSGDKVLSTTRIKDKTKDYESLLNIPTLNDVEIKGDKTANDYNIGNGLKVDEAKVTYKDEEVSFKDFILDEMIDKVGEKDECRAYFENRTNYKYCFYEAPVAEIPYFKTNPEVKNYIGMFEYSHITKAPLLDFSHATTMELMFLSCAKLKEVELKGIELGNLNVLARTFENCSLLETIITPINGRNIQTSYGFSDTFKGCSSLKTVSFVPQTIKVNISFSDSPLLSVESVKSIIDGLAPVTTATTLTFHKDIVLSDEQKQQITDKGWTLVQA